MDHCESLWGDAGALVMTVFGVVIMVGAAMPVGTDLLVVVAVVVVAVIVVAVVVSTIGRAAIVKEQKAHACACKQGGGRVRGTPKRARANGVISCWQGHKHGSMWFWISGRSNMTPRAGYCDFTNRCLLCP